MIFSRSRRSFNDFRSTIFDSVNAFVAFITLLSFSEQARALANAVIADFDEPSFAVTSATSSIRFAGLSCATWCMEEENII